MFFYSHVCVKIGFPVTVLYSYVSPQYILKYCFECRLHSTIADECSCKVGVHHTLHLFVVGLRGSGRSSILNTLLGRAYFGSGVDDSRGERTEILETVSLDGNKYSNFRGLNSSGTRKRAAEEIARELSQNGTVRLMFVVTSNETSLGYLAEPTISSFLKALEIAGVDVEGRFSVILNKCTRDVMVHCQKHKKFSSVGTALDGNATIFWRYP